MKNYEYANKLPSPNEYNVLRKNVGWGEMPIDVVEKSFEKTLHGVSV
jgi:hypothetical protein